MATLRNKIQSTKFIIMIISTAVVVLAMFLSPENIGMVTTAFLTLSGLYMGANAFQNRNNGNGQPAVAEKREPEQSVESVE